MAGGGKKKAVKLTWQEMQAQFGDVSRNPIDNLPTSSRSQSDRPPRESFRSSHYERERREEREEAPSRADESSAWRSSRPAGGAGAFRDDRPSGRSDDGMWRSSRPPTSSFGSNFGGRRDELSRDREPDTAGRPRLNLIKPSSERLAAAQEQQQAAKAALSEEQSTSKPNPFGDAKPVSSSVNKANPFGDAKPVERPSTKSTTAEPWRPRIARDNDNRSETSLSNRFARPTEDTPTSSGRFARPAEEPQTSSRFARPTEEPQASNRFARLSDAAPARPRDEPVVKLTPSLPPKKVSAPAPEPASPVFEERTPSPARSLKNEPEPSGPIRSALEVSMAEGTWVTADELADCIGQVSLDTDESVEALGNVVGLSLAQKTVLLPSAVSLIPKDKLPGVLQVSLSHLTKSLSPEAIEDIVGDVNVVQALGIDSSLKREEAVAKLKEMGLEQFAPKEDVGKIFKSLCDKSPSCSDLLSELKSRFPRKSKVPVIVSSVVSEYITRRSLSSGAFDQDVLEQNRDVLSYIGSTVKSQTSVLFGVQEAWFAHGTGIKRSGKALFEALYEMRLISVDAMVAWLHDQDRPNGKRKLLLQCGGYISELQNSAIAHQFENSDSDESVDLDSDFPQANRNYDDY